MSSIITSESYDTGASDDVAENYAIAYLTPTSELGCVTVNSGGEVMELTTDVNLDRSSYPRGDQVFLRKLVGDNISVPVNQFVVTQRTGYQEVTNAINNNVLDELLVHLIMLHHAATER